MAKIKFDLEPGEEKVGKGTIHYLPPTGGKFAGKLLVTDRRILFQPLDPKQDLSLASAIDSFSVDGRDVRSFRNYWDGEALRIPRADVRSVKEQRSGTMKQVVLTLADGQEVVFDNGFLSVDKLAATPEG